MKEVNSGQGLSPALPAANKLREVVPARAGAGQALHHSRGFLRRPPCHRSYGFFRGPISLPECTEALTLPLPTWSWVHLSRSLNLSGQAAVWRPQYGSCGSLVSCQRPGLTPEQGRQGPSYSWSPPSGVVDMHTATPSRAASPGFGSAMVHSGSGAHERLEHPITTPSIYWVGASFQQRLVPWTRRYTTDIRV